jgi:hypothetical protein
MYDYGTERPYVFTDAGSRQLLKVRDFAFECFKTAGSVRADKLMIGGGDSWKMMALIDRLVEIGDIFEVTKEVPAWQCRVFVKTHED